MPADVDKQLERAKRFLEKNKLPEAIEAYQEVLQLIPNHMEAIQALADLLSRNAQPERAAVYYGMLFDRMSEAREEARAFALYTRFLRGVAQPPQRLSRYALLLQKQNRQEEAIDFCNKAADQFRAQQDNDGALGCLERIAELDPENLTRHLSLAQTAAAAGKPEMAARAYLRAGQLAASSGELEKALEFFGQAHGLVPGERSAALLYADGLLRRGDVASAAQAVKLLEPLASAESDALFLETFGVALLRTTQLDRARAVLEQLYRDKPDGFPRLFELARAYLQAQRDEQALDVLAGLKSRMLAARQQSEFAAQMDRLGEEFPSSLRLLEFWAQLYSDLSREAKYFDVMVLLFDARLASGDVPRAYETLDRLVDIDPYDYRNLQRLERLQGRVEDARIQSLRTRLAHAVRQVIPPAQPPTEEAEEPEPASLPPPLSGNQTLDDLIVQAEIFLQYSLESKAIERLEKIAELFPGEEQRNPRLRALQESAKWRPEGAEGGAAAGPPSPPAGAGGFSSETLRDLSKIAEINRAIYRQATPRAVLSVAVDEVGKYLKASRCLAIIGAPGAPPQMAAEFCAPGFAASPGGVLFRLLAQIERAAPDQLGGLPLEASAASALREIGLETALTVLLTDKETVEPAGLLLVGHGSRHAWKQNETYFLQAVGDQMLLTVNHTRLRSLVRTLAVADEKTGLLARSSYQDCLLSEAQRAKSQRAPLALAILQVDRAPELAQSHGDAALDRHLEQMAKAVLPVVRQNDIAVKYSSSALAFILPDTPLNGAQGLAEKLRRVAASVAPAWGGNASTLSGGVVEAAAPAEYDSEDIVTDLINRAESALEEARSKGGNLLVTAAIPNV